MRQILTSKTKIMKNRIYVRRFLKQAFIFILLANILPGAFPVSAQQKQAAKTPPKAGWSGTISYRKTLVEDYSSDEKVFGRVNDSERIKHNYARNYSYSGKMIVNDLAGTGRATTSTKVELKDNDYHKVVQTELTNCHSWEPDRMITAESTDRKLTSGTGEGEAYSYSLSVNGDKFSLGFTFPEFQGKYTHTTSATYKNLCPDSTRKPENSSKDSEVRIPGGGASIEGSVDPRNPDVLEGSKSWYDTVGNKKSFVYVVTWKLRRKPVPLMITDLKFYTPLYPSPNDWREIQDTGDAIDGNQIKIVATIANLGATDKTVTVNFKELKENAVFPNATATIPANSQKDVEIDWDSSGFAWRQTGADVVLETNRQIEVRIPDDSMQKDVKIYPKPVIIVPGFWQQPEALTRFYNSFKVISDGWMVHSPKIVYDSATENVDAVDNLIRETQRGYNAWHVDMVALTTGGLSSRIYVNSKMPTLFDGRPAATHLVMVGVPNLGTPCAVGLKGLGLKAATWSLDMISEISPASMKKFNLLVNNTNGTKFAAIANTVYPETCQEEVGGDGLVSVNSAIWRTKVNAVTNLYVKPDDYIGEVAVFKQIFKWLAVPPKGDHNPDPSTLAGNFANENLLDPSENNFGKTRNYGAMFADGNLKADDDESDPKPDFAKVIALPGKQTTEVEIPVTNGSEIALNLFASPEISATLFDEKGEIVGKNLANTPEAAGIFRTIRVKKAFQNGKWKLRIENPNQKNSEILVTAFIDYNLKIAARK